MTHGELPRADDTKSISRLSAQAGGGFRVGPDAAVLPPLVPAGRTGVPVAAPPEDEAKEGADRAAGPAPQQVQIQALMQAAGAWGPLAGHVTR